MGRLLRGRYSSASGMFANSSGDEKRKAQERLETLLLEGLQGEETE